LEVHLAIVAAISAKTTSPSCSKCRALRSLGRHCEASALSGSPSDARWPR